jgi:hypothetical protein
MINDSLPEGNGPFPAYGAPPPTANRVEVHCFVGRAVSYLIASFF